MPEVRERALESTNAPCEHNLTTYICGGAAMWCRVCGAVTIDGIWHHSGLFSKWRELRTLAAQSQRTINNLTIQVEQLQLKPRSKGHRPA